MELELVYTRWFWESLEALLERANSKFHHFLDHCHRNALQHGYRGGKGRGKDGIFLTGEKTPSLTSPVDRVVQAHRMEIEDAFGIELRSFEYFRIVAHDEVKNRPVGLMVRLGGPSRRIALVLAMANARGKVDPTA